MRSLIVTSVCRTTGACSPRSSTTLAGGKPPRSSSVSCSFCASDSAYRSSTSPGSPALVPMSTANLSTPALANRGHRTTVMKTTSLACAKNDCRTSITLGIFPDRQPGNVTARQGGRGERLGSQAVAHAGQIGWSVAEHAIERLAAENVVEPRALRQRQLLVRLHARGVGVAGEIDAHLVRAVDAEDGNVIL